MKMLKKDSDPSLYRIWYNDWVSQNARGKVLDVGKSKYWEYGFPTIDINPKMKPTYLGNIKHTAFPDNTFDLVLCNGMIEFVENPQVMINEIKRILKFGGTAIFGFVGNKYPPYKKNWRYYDGKEYFFGNIYRKNFDNEYYFIICKKI